MIPGVVMTNGGPVIGGPVERNCRWGSSPTPPARSACGAGSMAAECLLQEVHRVPRDALATRLSLLSAPSNPKYETLNPL
jgi:hypothetical protein